MYLKKVAGVRVLVEILFRCCIAAMVRQCLHSLEVIQVKGDHLNVDLIF